MRQYLDAKQQNRDAILFFRMGDFYEMFYEDALVAARALELTLTSRSKDANGGGIPMCGVPFHAVDGYITRLVKKGFRVAICDQVEDPRKAKGLVKREVVRVVSPGTLTDASYLDAREPAFLMAIAGAACGSEGASAAEPAGAIGVALLDLSTGEFTAAEYHGAAGPAALADEIALLKPREIIVPADVDIAARLPMVAAVGPPRDAGRCVDLRWRVRAPRAPRSTANGRARGLRPGGAWSGRGGRRCAGAASPHHTEARSGACARHPVPRAQRHAARRSDDAQAPRDRRRIRGRPHGLAARRARSHGHLDRQPAPPIVAARTAGRPRADSRSARRGRRAGVSNHRSRQVPRGIEERPGPRAPGRPGRARHGRAARFSGPEAVADGHPPRPHRPRRPAGSARPLARRGARRPGRRAGRDRAHGARRRRRRWRATAVSSATASTRSSTNCARSADRANR